MLKYLILNNQAINRGFTTHLTFW